MNRPFEYHWSIAGYSCRAVETMLGVIEFFQRHGNGRERKVEHPIGLTNELVQLVELVRGLRCDLAALGAHESSCAECDDYDPEAIAACPHCLKPLCDTCMALWHQNKKCKER